jgi:hypothetical protein
MKIGKARQGIQTNRKCQVGLREIEWQEDWSIPLSQGVFALDHTKPIVKTEPLRNTMSISSTNPQIWNPNSHLSAVNGAS